MDNNTIIINDIPHTLVDIEQLIWKNLVNGAVKSRDGFHTLTVGTVNPKNEVDIRTVVLRRTDELQKLIFFHTDTRSRKYQALSDDNRVSLLFYDSHRRMQLGIKATVILHADDALKQTQWQNTNAQSRRCYMTLEPPHQESSFPTVGYDTLFSRQDPTPDDSDSFSDHFCVVECKVHELECLFLHHGGNHKALFEYDNGQCIKQSWRVP